MCEVATIASLALVAAGTAATAYGASQADKAQAGATNEELARQKKLSNDADAVLARSIAGNSAKKTQEDAATQTDERTQAYSQAAADTAKYAPLGVDTSAAAKGESGANRVVADAYQGQANDASNYVRQQGVARAAMQGFDDALLNNSIFTQNNGYDLQKLGSFMQGSSNVLPYELNSAGHKGDTSKTIGGILQALGAVTGAAGATGAFGGAAAGAAGQAANAYTAQPKTQPYRSIS